MKATITVAMDNAAFAHNQGHELARILDRLAHRLRNDGARATDGAKLLDANGNTVGFFKLSGREL